jgi:hypothetical protein
VRPLALFLDAPGSFDHRAPIASTSLGGRERP